MTILLDLLVPMGDASVKSNLNEFDIDIKPELADLVAFARGFVGDILFMMGDTLDRVAVRLIDLSMKVDRL